MVNKKFWLGMMVLALVFGMAVVGCDDGSTNGGGNTYDLTGTWDVTISGQNATVTIACNNWLFDGPETAYDDTGTFTLSVSGNIATLYSDFWSANIGTATITSNTTMILTLHNPSLITGTFNGVKR